MILCLVRVSNPKTFRRLTEDESKTEERDKNPTRGNMSPPEQQEINSRALKFSEREDDVDRAEHVAG